MISYRHFFVKGSFQKLFSILMPFQLPLTSYKWLLHFRLSITQLRKTQKSSLSQRTVLLRISWMRSWPVNTCFPPPYMGLLSLTVTSSLPWESKSQTMSRVEISSLEIITDHSGIYMKNYRTEIIIQVLEEVWRYFVEMVKMATQPKEEKIKELQQQLLRTFPLRVVENPQKSAMKFKMFSQNQNVPRQNSIPCLMKERSGRACRD